MYSILYQGLLEYSQLQPLKTKDHPFHNLSSSLVALLVVITTTYVTTSDDKDVKLTIFCFQWQYIAHNKPTAMAE